MYTFFHLFWQTRLLILEEARGLCMTIPLTRLLFSRIISTCCCCCCRYCGRMCASDDSWLHKHKITTAHQVWEGCRSESTSSFASFILTLASCLLSLLKLLLLVTAMMMMMMMISVQRYTVEPIWDTFCATNPNVRGNNLRQGTKFFPSN